MSDALKRELAERIATGKVLVVVGTGVSLAATGGEKLASWKGLIADGVERCVQLNAENAEWESLQKRLLDLSGAHNLLGVAENVQSLLNARGQGDWSEWLRRTVGSLKPASPAIIEAIRGLHVPIATLNYDELLERPEPRRGFYTWQEAESWQRVLEGEDDAILHLHGRYDRPSTVVLALQLQGSFEVSLSSSGLVGSSPSRPGDHEGGLDPALGEARGDATDLLERPAHERDGCRTWLFGGAPPAW